MLWLCFMAVITSDLGDPVTISSEISVVPFVQLGTEIDHLSVSDQ